MGRGQRVTVLKQIYKTCEYIRMMHNQERLVKLCEMIRVTALVVCEQDRWVEGERGRVWGGGKGQEDVWGERGGRGATNYAL